MKYLFYFLCLWIVVTSQAQSNSVRKSAPLVTADPASVGISAERLEKIDAMCKKAVADKEVPGMVALIARNGKIVFHRAYGTADAETNKSLQPNSIFRIASQSKAITATAVMTLWEEGKFQLDDPISNYIPEFKGQQIIQTFNEADSTFTGKPVEHEITIRHLLTHTSGIGYGVIDGDPRFRKIYHKAGVTDLFTSENITIEQSVKKLAKLPLHHEPGERFTYSEGLDVLGYFIEIVSGKPFDVYLKERIFDPLGMNDTGFYLPPEKADRLVNVQMKDGDGWKNYPVTFYDPQYPVKGAKRFFSGGAGLSSTAKDYATFLQMYLNGGELNGKRILSRTTIKSIMGQQIGDILIDNGQRYYGLAFGVTTQKGQNRGAKGSVGTFDWGGYFNTQYYADPQEMLIGIIMKQTQGPLSDGTGSRFRVMSQAAIDD